MRLIRKGKVKDIYEIDSETFLFHFSDRVSAFDIKMATPIPRKGEVLCKFGKFWFDSLDAKNHMIKVTDNDKMVVKKLEMIPMECVVRGYFYGSLIERYDQGKSPPLPSGFKPLIASKLPSPIFDPTTKSEEHDRPVGKQEIVAAGALSADEYDHLGDTSISLYKKMSQIVERAGFIIADVKFEFGRDADRKITLGDSLGPDEYRLWLQSDYKPGKIQESYDKQLLRDWLIKIGFKGKVDELAKEGKKPDAPEIPPSVANELSRRYIFAYEKISGLKL